MTIREVHIQGNDEIVDILRLTCIEAGIRLLETPDKVSLTVEGQQYLIIATELTTDIKHKG